VAKSNVSGLERDVFLCERVMRGSPPDATHCAKGVEEMTRKNVLHLEIEELEERIAPTVAPGLQGYEGQPGNQGGGGGSNGNGLLGYEGQPGNQGG